MDVENAGPKPDPKDLEPRPPKQEDLVGLCRQLNQAGAQYVVVGGFAIISAGYPRMTNDIDLIVATDAANEARVYHALATLPDNAVRELQPGELDRFIVIRVADEFIVDLMKAAGDSGRPSRRGPVLNQRRCALASSHLTPPSAGRSTPTSWWHCGR